MNKLLTCVCFLAASYVTAVSTFLSKSDFKVWGPGLKPHIITMPARYFFITTVSRNERCNTSQLDIQVQGITHNSRPCRVWTNILYCKGCRHIVRYKLYEACKSLTINVKFESNHVAESPYVINQNSLPEDCNCSRKNIDKWLVDWECGKIPNQIVNDLAQFNYINFDGLRDKIIAKYDNPGAISLCHYVIKQNKVYRKCYGQYVGFKMFVDSILLSLSRKIVLPDLEFFINLGDWPLVKDQTENIPIFSWCGSTDSYDIILPTYDITESTLENMGRITLDMLSVQGNVKESWENRIPKAFWRGRDSNRERLHLIDISREHPDLFNVSLTNFFFFRTEEQKYGPKADHVSFFTFFDYKYQLNIDGTVAAYRLPYLLAGGSLLLKQESKYYEHFYNELTPYVHYIPIKKDLSDLVEQIHWAIYNDKEARNIAEHGQDFAIKNLLPQNIFCYYAFLLREFGKKIISAVNILDNMEIVEKPETTNCYCDEGIKDEL